MTTEETKMAVFRIIGGIFTGTLGIIGIIWGAVGLILSFVFLIPLLGWVNWLIIPFILFGIVISILGAANEDTKTLGVIGIVLGSGAFVISVLRLALGGGVI